MAVNWQNLFIAIEKGKSSYDQNTYSFENYKSIDKESYENNPISELDEAVRSYYINRGDIFLFGSSRWGGKDIVG